MRKSILFFSLLFLIGLCGSAFASGNVLEYTDDSGKKKTVYIKEAAPEPEVPSDEEDDDGMLEEGSQGMHQEGEAPDGQPQTDAQKQPNSANSDWEAYLQRQKNKQDALAAEEKTKLTQERQAKIQMIAAQIDMNNKELKHLQVKANAARGEAKRRVYRARANKLQQQNKMLIQQLNALQAEQK